MNTNVIIELDDDAEMIDLGVASLETEGGGMSDGETDSSSPPGVAH